MIKAKWIEQSYLFMAGSMFLSLSMADRVDAQVGHTPTNAADDNNRLQELADKAGAITQQMGRLDRSKLRPRALQFYSKDCPFCVLFDQLLQSAKQQFSDKIEFQMVDAKDPANAALVAQYEVTQVPTLMCVDKDGDKVSGLIGYVSSDDVNWALSRLMNAGQQAYVPE